MGDKRAWSACVSTGQPPVLMQAFLPFEQVKNRCRCSKAGQCGELEALVLKEGAAGHLPPTPPAHPAKVEQLLLSDW